MKTLKDLKGVKELSKSEQRAITGGLACRTSDHGCPTGSYCRPDGLCQRNGKACRGE
jgi:hypothetical protein